jgi:hypothetical protein
LGAAQGEQGFVFDNPLDGLAARELHGLSDGGREVDVPLFAGFAPDKLDFGEETHGGRAPLNLVISLDIKTRVSVQQKSLKMFFI